MTQSTSCPDSAELKALLDGTLPETEQAELNNHLETCPHCQQHLEELVAGKESWSGAAEQLSQQEQEPNADLERIVEQLKKEGEAGQAETEAPPSDEVPLDFLDPPENPKHLGRLGHYEIIEVIGRGGMGVVLKAFDSALHRVVAIKVLAPQLATSLAARKRFEREARAAAAISHEHIVAIYAVEETKGLPYLVMEYVAGVSLQERLDRSGALEIKEILRIGMQTAKGLAAAHAQGLVHRDIKPANILLHNGVERVKITDFGLARAMDDASVTQSGYVAGTPQYMAPEQARGEAIDHRADLFSLGSVLYALSAGRPPFRGSTAMAVLRRVSEESPQPLAEINPDIPLWLAEIIAKLHAKSPAERFQSAQEVAELLGEHLAQVQRSGETGGQRTEQQRSRTPRSAPGASRFRWVKAAALFLPLIAGGLVLTEETGLTQIKQWVATVLRISTSEGTLIVEVDDPQVQVTVDGEELAIHGAGLKEIRLKPGEHRVQATKDGKPVPVDKDLVTISRGGKQIVRVRQEEIKQKQTIGQPREAAVEAALPEVTVQHPRQVEATPVQQYTGRLASQPGDPIRIIFDMNERSFLEYQALMRQHKVEGPGSPLYVGLLNEQDYPRRATLTGFNDRIDPKTGTMQVYGTMPNPGGVLLPGLSVRVEMPFGRPRRVLEILQSVPWFASGKNSRECYVLVLNEKDIVERRTVKEGPGGFVVHEKDVTGKDILDFGAQKRMRIFEEGLDPTDWVVVNGHTMVRPGDHVKRRIVEEKTSAPRVSNERAALQGIGKIVIAGTGNAPSTATERATLQERLATLQEIAATKERLFHDGRLTIQEFLPAKLAVLHAELGLAESPKKRIEIHEKIVAYSREIEQALDQLYQQGRITKPELLIAKQKRLEAEAALEQAKAKAAAHSK